MAVCQNLVTLVNIKIAGKWMFIPLKMGAPRLPPLKRTLARLVATQLGRTAAVEARPLGLCPRAPAAPASGRWVALDKSNKKW